MGLLDGILGTSIDDPRTGATAAMVQGLLSGNNALGGMSQGLLGYQDQMARAKRQQQVEMMQKMQLAEMQRAMQQQAAQDKFRASIPSPQMQASQQAMQGGGGPTQANAAQMRQADPMAQFAHQAMQAGEMTPMQYMQMQQPKERKLMNVAAGASVIDEATGQPIYTAPKEQTQPAAIQEYAFAKQQGFGGSFNDFVIGQKKAGATSLSVNTGPKAFDNELGRAGVEILMKERETAQASAGILQSVGEIRAAVKGGAYQGSGAELKLGAAKALSALGMPYDAKTVANTEQFNAQANTFVLNSIKQLGANPSNADREFIEKTVPRLQTDPAALPKLLSFMEQKARGQINSYNAKAKQTQAGAKFLPFSIDVPVPSAGGSEIDDLVSKYLQGGK